MQHDKLEISMLGRFVIKRGETVYSDIFVQSQHFWSVLKFLLTNKTRVVNQDDIVGTLWEGKECVDAKAALHNIIYRIRKMLDVKTEKGSLISYVHGGYMWNDKIESWLDVDAMVAEVKNAKHHADKDLGKTIEHYKNAIALYRGGYLDEGPYYDWAFHARRNYKKIFLGAVTDLAMHLKAAGRHEEIIDVCECALKIEPLEESLHLELVRGMLALGKKHQAYSYFKDFSDIYFRGTGEKLAIDFASLEGGKSSSPEIMAKEGPGKHIAQNTTNDGGAFVCDYPTFCNILELEMQRGERSNQYAHCVVQLAVESEISRDQFHQHLIKALRKGDVICMHPSHIANLIICSADETTTIKIMSRIKNRLQHFSASKSPSIDYEIKQLGKIQESAFS